LNFPLMLQVNNSPQQPGTARPAVTGQYKSSKKAVTPVYQIKMNPSEAAIIGQYNISTGVNVGNSHTMIFHRNFSHSGQSLANNQGVNTITSTQSDPLTRSIIRRNNISN